MDENIKILLNSNQNIDSVNVNSYNKIELQNKRLPILEYDIRNVLSATEIFDIERETNEIYRIYGKIEYMSLLNGLRTGYSKLEHFFLPLQNLTTSKNLLNSFDFYLVRPAVSGYTTFGGNTGTSTTFYYVNEDFDDWITSTPSDYPAGWTVSVGVGSYVEQTVTNQAKFVLGNNPFINLITLSKELTTPAYGDITIETVVDILPNLIPGTDLFTIILFNGSNILHSFNTLSGSTGLKTYQVNVPIGTPVTKVTIIANSTNKSIFMDYFKMYTGTFGGASNTGFIRYFQVVATPNEFELFPVGFANNIYNEQTYGFSFNTDFDVSNYVDNFGFPLTELFLYAAYKKWNSPAETLSFTRFSTGGTATKVAFSTTSLNIGDYVKTTTGEKIGDVVEYSKPDFYQAQLTPQTFYIRTPYVDGFTSKALIWKYNPFIPFRLRYFSNEIYKTNINNSSYEQVMSIPYYATALDSGNYVWRTILPQGYVDPLTGIGVDYPFVNKKRYLFSTIILDVVPDLTDALTYTAFKDIKFGTPTNLNITPMSDLNNIGKPCL
jgi:hypothetical protein